MAKRKVNKFIPVKLTDASIILRDKKARDIHYEIMKICQDRDRYFRQFRIELKILRKDASHLVRTNYLGYEQQEIECFEEFLEDQTVQYTDKKGDLLWKRVMTDEEVEEQKQAELELKEELEPKKEKKIKRKCGICGANEAMYKDDRTCTNCKKTDAWKHGTVV